MNSDRNSKEPIDRPNVRIGRHNVDLDESEATMATRLMERYAFRSVPELVRGLMRMVVVDLDRQEAEERDRELRAAELELQRQRLERNYQDPEVRAVPMGKN